MFNPPPPTSQKYRPISFVLDDRAMGTPIQWVPLVVRPEDLVRTQPSRMSLHQTLGNPYEDIGWIDSFGPGLPTITISGNTGWRMAMGQGLDGAGQFELLQTYVYDLYHSLRQDAVDSAKNPADVHLLFVDELDRFAYEVVPMSFMLRRSKSRPLLMQYNIQMQTVSTTPEVPLPPYMTGGDVMAGLGALAAAIAKIASQVAGVMAGVQAAIGAAAAAVAGFVNAVVGVLGAVGAVVAALAGGVMGVANGLVGIASSMAWAGRNIFATIAAMQSLPSLIRHSVQRVAAAFNEVACILANSLRARGRRYPNYSDIYGASNCSSTTGGRPASPLAGMNVFEQLAPVGSPVLLSSDASASLGALERSDPVLAPMSSSEIGRHAGNVSAGFGGISPAYAASINAIVPGVLA